MMFGFSFNMQITTQENMVNGYKTKDSIFTPIIQAQKKIRKKLKTTPLMDY